MRIALVDDDPTVRQQMETWIRELTGNAAHIRTYSSGESFLSDWSAGTFDLIVLDIFMTGLTGMDVAHGRPIPMCVLSSAPPAMNLQRRATKWTPAIISKSLFRRKTSGGCFPV